MKVIKPNEVPEESADSPLFTGGRVTRQSLVTPEMGNNFSINIVNFSAGARNKMHIHTSDQVLFVTAGKSTGMGRRQTQPSPTSPWSTRRTTLPGRKSPPNSARRSVFRQCRGRAGQYW